MTGQSPVAAEFHGGIQRRLPAHRRENCVRFFPLDDGFNDLGCYRFDVGAIRELWICHDGRGIRVHQNDLVPFLAQRLASLNAGIIKFASLPDDNRAGPYQENLMEIVVPRHGRLRRIILSAAGARFFVAIEYYATALMRSRSRYTLQIPLILVRT